MVWVAFNSQTGLPLGDQVAAYENNNIKDDLTRAYSHYIDSVDHLLDELEIQFPQRGARDPVRERSRSPPRQCRVLKEGQCRVLKEGQSLYYDIGQVSVIYVVSSVGHGCCTIRKRYVSGDGGILRTRGYNNKTKQEHRFCNTFAISGP